jgi:pimeloyl-ACP methyl ester carboxylesterase
MPIRRLLSVASLASLALAGCATPGAGSLQDTDHRVSLTSTAPSMRGQPAQLYVREVNAAGAPKQPVVLFIHGAGTPAESSFDSRLEGYSWMRQVARAGFDVFSVSLTGYGGSTRPPPMADRCNIAKAQQPEYVAAACAPSYQGPITTMTSDWNDIDAAVEYVRRLRGVDRVSLVAWSQGGPRVTGYAALHPGKVDRIIALAPAYNRTGPTREPATLPSFPDGPMGVQSRADFIANWDRQVGCAGQYEPAAAKTLYDEILATDAVASKWGAGARRAPSVPTWGFNKETVGSVTTPFLMLTGIHDKQVPPERVRELYEDLGSPNKVLVDLGCSSHNAMWETNRKMLYDATVDWLKTGQLRGMTRGIVRMGY